MEQLCGVNSLGKLCGRDWQAYIVPRLFISGPWVAQAYQQPEILALCL